MSERFPDLGHTIVVARTVQGWSQDDLAKRLGVRRQAVSLWESGQPPQTSNLERLRQLLGPNVWTATPPARRISATDAKGVRYAALAMSETVTRLLREAVEAEEAAADAETAAAMRAAATIAARPLPVASAPAAAPRRRKGS